METHVCFLKTRTQKLRLIEPEPEELEYPKFKVERNLPHALPDATINKNYQTAVKIDKNSAVGIEGEVERKDRLA